MLITTLEMIEACLKEPVNTESLARACYASRSGLHKVFTYAFGCSVNEYITKRRITCASRELVTGDDTITDIALSYQYGSPEAFSRAFKRIWGVSPSEFRKTRRFTELLPRFRLEVNTGGMIMQKRQPIDISELYDELQKLKGTYVLCADLSGLDMFNKQQGHAAGDLMIAEAFARLEREMGEGMLLFRIGGDEFALLTGYTRSADAEALARKIAARNGEPFAVGTQSFPLSLFIGVSSLPTSALNCREALGLLYGAIDKAKKAEDMISMYSPEA